MSLNHRLPRSTPEAQGIASSVLLAFVEALDHNVASVHSLMLVRHGQVVAEGWWEPYTPDRPHMLFSLSKSFTATAVGLAVEEGLLSVDDTVASFFPDDLPANPSANLLAMRVRDLLTMSSGHGEDTYPMVRAAPDGNWAKAFLELPVAHEPGSLFVYNTGATYMLAAILQRVTEISLLDYLQPRLFAPLGIENPTWESCPRGINVGGTGLNITTEDIASFGQLYLQQGVWHGEQIVSHAWIADATAKQIETANDTGIDWAQGYGYQFWRCRHDAYRADGAFGQFCIVFPEHDTILAFTSGVENTQGLLNQVWEHLLPALQSAPLAEDATAQAQLRDKLAHLLLPPIQGSSFSPPAACATSQTYRIEANDQQVETLTFAFDDQTCTLTIGDKHGEHQIVSGIGKWHKGVTTFGGFAYPQVAASGAWTATDTYTMTLCFYETPFSLTATCHFADDQLRVQVAPNVTFGPKERPDLVGQRD